MRFIHLCLSILSARQLRAASAMVLLCACGKSGQITLMPNPRAQDSDLEVILVPTDPAPLIPRQTSFFTTAQADSLRLLTAFEDSSRTLDEQFSHVRDSLNSEAAALANIDRHSSEYAKRFDEFRPGSAHAESLRAARDRIQSKAAALHSALAALLPDSARIQAKAREARTAIDGARGAAGMTRVIPLRGQPVVVRLQAGSWWIGVAQPDAMPPRFRKMVIAAGSQDTVRVPLAQ
jgi:hypothetical protein